MKTFLLFFAILNFILCKEPVKVTLLVQAEDDEGDEFIQIKLFITKHDESLSKALSQSQKLANQIVNKAKTLCQAQGKSKRCNQATQIQNPEIQSKYQIVRKQSTFQHFIVKREITINVYKVETLGNLVDQLQKLGVTKFQDFTWKNQQEQQQQEIVIQNAKERAANLCESFDYKFQKIVEVTQLQPEDEDQQKQDEDDDDEDEQQNIYQVVVECVHGKAAKK